MELTDEQLVEICTNCYHERRQHYGGTGQDGWCTCLGCKAFVRGEEREAA